MGQSQKKDIALLYGSIEWGNYSGEWGISEVKINGQ